MMTAIYVNAHTACSFSTVPSCGGPGSAWVATQPTSDPLGSCWPGRTQVQQPHLPVPSADTIGEGKTWRAQDPTHQAHHIFRVSGKEELRPCGLQGQVHTGTVLGCSLTLAGDRAALI